MKTLWLSGFLGMALWCLLTSNASARTWYVNPSGTGDALTVQAGLDSATAGDTVLVACGTYYEHGILMKSGVCLRGETSFPPCVTLDAEQSQYLMIASLNDASTLIEGVAFTHASNAAINASYSDLTVQNCVFTGNAGIALLITSASPVFSNCLIYGNLDDRFHAGSAISSSFAAQPVFTFCTIAENSGGAILAFDGGITLDHCIIAFSRDRDAINYDWLTLPGFVTLSCSDFFGNHGTQDSAAAAQGSACFSADPQFCGIRGSGNFYLQSDSPCVPGNHPDGSGCGIIGALPVMCGTVKTEARTWGSIKALYSPDN
jgi:hypothetical protein